MSSGLTDAHCHLELIAEAGETADAVVQGALGAGVDRLVNIGLGPDNEAVLATARRTPGVHCTVGWHPHQDRPPADDELSAMAAMCAAPEVVAVGEVGLDYYWRPGYHEVSPDIQKASFSAMLGLAGDAGLAAVVHCRDAHVDTLEMLAGFPGVRAVMHAFSGDVDFARQCAERGYFVSVAGPVTYPSAQGLRDALQEVPTELLLVETDAPFLPPQPWRGKPSRPAMVVETARRLAAIKGMEFDELVALTSANADRAFRFAPSS